MSSDIGSHNQLQFIGLLTLWERGTFGFAIIDEQNTLIQSNERFHAILYNLNTTTLEIQAEDPKNNVKLVDFLDKARSVKHIAAFSTRIVVGDEDGIRRTIVLMCTGIMMRTSHYCMMTCYENWK